MLTTAQNGQSGPRTHWKPRGVTGLKGPLWSENRCDILVRMRLVLVSLLILLVSLGAAGQTSDPAAGPRALPPLSWTCPMHPEVLEGESGQCPICHMHLVQVRLERAWSCPVHTMIIDSESGRCPICQRSLVPMTVSLFWRCPGSDEHEHSPGLCPDGSERVAVRERRIHGDHNPRHGGQFFMAPDNWHHIEGTYPAVGVFRLFVYDEMTSPEPLAGVEGRVVSNEVFNPTTGEVDELEIFPLQPSDDGQYLEARIRSAALPVELAAKVRFAPNGPEFRFDFIFSEYTTEPTVDKETRVR